MLDIEANRRARKYSSRELALRVAWLAGQCLFRLIPRPLHGPRVAVLRLFGARIGRHVHVYPSARIECPWNLEVGDWSAIGAHVVIYNLGPITLGRRVTISQRAHLCAGTHDDSQCSLPLLKPPVRIDDDAWIATDAFVGPGVVVGAGAVVGARAVAMKPVSAWVVVVGNPARVIRQRRLSDSRHEPVQTPLPRVEPVPAAKPQAD